MFTCGGIDDVVDGVVFAWHEDQLSCMYGVSVALNNLDDHPKQEEKEMN